MAEDDVGESPQNDDPPGIDEGQQGDRRGQEDLVGQERADEQVAAEQVADGRSASMLTFFVLLLPGVGLFAIGLLAFVSDLATGHDVLRSIGATSLGAAALITWAGHDSYSDPESGVATLGGAVGTGMILLGLYLLAGGVVVGVSSLVHDRLVLGLAMIGAGVPFVLGGFLVLPVEALPGDRSDAEGEAGTTE